MTVTLAKTELTPMMEQRLVRMRNDIVVLQRTAVAEIRACYDVIEAMRNALSEILDKADGKN